MLTYLVVLESCWKNISMYCWSPIQRTRFLFLLECHAPRISECTHLVCNRSAKFLTGLTFKSTSEEVDKQVPVQWCLLCSTHYHYKSRWYICLRLNRWHPTSRWRHGPYSQDYIKSYTSKGLKDAIGLQHKLHFFVGVLIVYGTLNRGVVNQGLGSKIRLQGSGLGSKICIKDQRSRIRIKDLSYWCVSRVLQGRYRGVTGVLQDFVLELSQYFSDAFLVIFQYYPYKFLVHFSHFPGTFSTHSLYFSCSLQILSYIFLVIS